MAFATANVKKDYLGALKVTHGTWSGAAGDAAGTIAVEGGTIYMASFSSQDSSGAQIMWPCKISTSGTSGVVTITVYNTAAVTAGRFIIFHL